MPQGEFQRMSIRTLTEIQDNTDSKLNWEIDASYEWGIQQRDTDLEKEPSRKYGNEEFNKSNQNSRGQPLKQMKTSRKKKIGLLGYSSQRKRKNMN